MTIEIETVPAADHHQLKQAFFLFSQASDRLSEVYSGLQQQVLRLNQELTLTSGELQRELAAKEALSQRLDQLLTALPGGIVVLDQKSCINRINPAAERLLGKPLLGCSWQQIVDERLQPTDETGEWCTRQHAVAGARRVYIESSTSATTDECILLIHDVTEAHVLRELNRRNQRLAAMGEMAAGLAHQLRTPLATALLYVGHLNSEALSPEARHNFATKTMDRLLHLEHLISNMLLFAKGGTALTGRTNLSVLLQKLQQVLLPQMQQRNLLFSVVDHSEDAILPVSEEALCGALLNLLDNAMQVSPAGALVTLSCTVNEEEVRLTVSDDGPGIEPALLERLFEPFFTTRPKGTGLGLAIVHNVITAMQGEIFVEAVPDGGSQFIVRLPRKTEPTLNSIDHVD